SIVAAGLVRVVESLVVEGLVAEDHVVRSRALRGLEVRGLHECVVVVTLFGSADATKRGRPVAQIASRTILQQGSVDGVGRWSAGSDETVSPRRISTLDEQPWRQDAVVADGEQILRQFASSQTRQVHHSHESMR